MSDRPLPACPHAEPTDCRHGSRPWHWWLLVVWLAASVGVLLRFEYAAALRGVLCGL